MIGGYAGFYYGSYGKGGGLKNFVIANNTFYKATSTMLSIDNDAGHTNTLIANNIFYQTGGGAMSNLTANSGLRFQHNLWYGGSAGAAAGTGDVNAEPKLLNPGTTTDVDYKLQAGSPAIDAGAQLINSVPKDYAGSSRPLGKGYDIGAYEYVQKLYYQACQENKEKLNSHKSFVTQIRFLCVKKFKVNALVITQPIF